jgi:hypothetical protein
VYHDYFHNYRLDPAINEHRGQSKIINNTLKVNIPHSNRMGNSGLASSGSGVMGSCEYGTEASHSKEHGNFLSGFSWRALPHGII